MKRISILLRPCATLLFLLGLMLGPALAASDPFPAYPCLKANVAFWKKVYSQYPSNQGLIHDRQNLAIIYEVLALPDNDKVRERTVEAVKERYRTMLLALAQGQPASTPEEKRVAGLFGPGCNSTSLRAAADNIRLQRCLSDRFRAGVARSGRYLEHIKEIFSHYGLPSDLAYLPHVESSFNYQAYSKTGAAGIWQLMPATGRRFLTISSSLDERRDPILATHAAAKYLQGNYRKLQDWPLAVTAYNHGLTSILRARNSLGSYEKIFHGYDNANANFGFASQNFYAEFLAAREIAKNYPQYFKDLRLDPPVRLKEYTVNSRTGLRDLARHLQVAPGTLAEVNPALTSSVLSGRRPVPKGYRLRLPRAAASDSRLAALPVKTTASSPAPAPTPAPAPAPAPAKAPAQAQAPVPVPATATKAQATKTTATKKSRSTHRVKPGETVVKIAERYGVSPRALMASNQLGRGALITVGQNLQIPSPAQPKAQKVVR